MTNLKNTLRDLWKQGIEIYLEEGELRYNATTLTEPQTVEKLFQEHSQEIADILQQEPDLYTGFPLSHGQQAMVLMQEITPSSTAYNATAALQLKADLNIALLQQAMDFLVQRHEALRTEFCRIEGALVQRVLPFHPKPIPVVEVQAYDDDAVGKWVDELADIPFDVSSGTNFITCLLDNKDPQGAHNRYILLILGHHASIDFIAVENLASELAIVYTQLAEGRQAELPAINISYKEYVIAEMQSLAGERGETLWNYWQPQLSTINSVLELPIDYPRPPQQSFRGTEYKFDIDTLLYAAIKKVAMQLRATPFVIVMAAYQILVQRYGRENTVALGVPMGNRTQYRCQKVVGHFTNAIPLIADLSPNPTFAELVANNLELLKGAMAHQDLPLPYMVNRLQLDYDLSRPALVQTGFSWNQTNHRKHNVGTGSIIEEVRRSEQRGAIYDLVMSGYDNGKTVACSLRYNTDLFKHETVEQMSKHFLQLLRGIIAAPQEPINKLVMVTNKELGEQLDVDSSQLAAITPLTATQQDLYLAHIINADTETNSVGAMAELKTEVDANIIKEEFQHLINGNQLLRGRIVACDKRYCDIAYWVIDKQKAVKLIQTDLSEKHLDDGAMLDYVNNLVYQPYDIHGELYHFELIKRGPAHFALLVVANHIIFDGVSVNSVLHQCLTNYELRLKGLAAHDTEDNFSAYITKSKEQFDSYENRRYWEKKFSTVESLDIPAPTNSAGKQVFKQIVLDSQHLQRIKNYSGEHSQFGASTSTGGIARYFKALYCLLINAYARPTADFQIRDTWSGRTKDDRLTIGCYHQMVPFIAPHALMKPSANINTLFAYTRKHIKEVSGHSQISLLLQNQLAPPGQLGFMYNFYITASDIPYAGDKAKLTILAPLDVQGQVQLIIKQENDQLLIGLLYEGDLFPDLQFLERLISLSEQVLDGAQQVGDLHILFDDEREQLLSTRGGAWNATEVKSEPVAALHHLIEQQVERTPDAIAISFADSSLSYRELNERANQLAHYLRDTHGVGPDVMVGLCMERSLELSVALLAVLKAGGAYVPFDPSFPQDRLGFMLEDTQVPVMLTQSHLQSHLPTNQVIKRLCMDTDDALWSKQPSNDLDTAIESENLFNVIFTSGSTGKPKGVMVPHRGIINRLRWMQKTYPIDANDRILQKTPYSFDVSVWELFWPLMVGAQLVYAKPDGHKDPDYLRDIIRENNITTLHFVPSMLGVFLQTPEIEQCDSIRRVFCSGEALQPEHVRRFFQRIGNSELHNLYGPTEASVDVSYFACQANTDYRSVPIGKPVDNTQLHILDNNLQPVPVGLVGELYIGGTQLARGYLKREELTRSTFIDNPFYTQGTNQGHPSKRLYKSGDLARYLPDGNIEYIGRVDFQVKVRGLRIELGEIENVLHQHAQVKETTVITKDLGSDNVVIIAYLVAEDLDDEPSDDSLRQHLRQHLPEYMLPNFFVALDAMPLSANGKTDRKALPDPVLGTSGNDYVAPRNEIEHQIAAIWQELLQISKVGIHDNFFDSGGHSLLATQTVSRLQEVLSKEISIRALFDFPTVASLAQHLEKTDHSQQLPAIKVMDRPKQMPLSLAQQRLWFVEQLNPGSVAYNMPAALQLHGPLDEQVLNRALQTIIQRHETLQTSFIDSHGKAEQQINDYDWSMLVTDFSNLNQDEQQQQVYLKRQQLAQHTFDLACAPLLSVELLRLNKQEHVLLFCMHHIISDGWSLEVLLAELGQLWQAYEKGQDSPLADLKVQYADFTLWQHDWIQGDLLDKQLNYWREQLRGAPALLQLPTDFPRPPQQSFSGAVYQFEISADTSQKLRQIGQQQNASLFMTLISAYGVLLNRYSQQDDICIGFPISGRNLPEMEPLIGLFVNNLVIRTDLSENPSFFDLINTVRQTTLEAYDHQDVPFDHIIEALSLERSLSYTPLLQVSFSLQNQAMEQQIEQMLGRPAQILDNDWLSAKYDLHMICSDGADKIGVELEYCQDLFERSTIERMAQQFNTLLEALLETPQQKVGNINLSSEKESARLLATTGDAWNATQIDYAAPPALQLLFEQQVDKTPDAPALSYENKIWTYQELNERANQLAHHLMDKGVGPDVIVGVCMERSLEMSVALLAVLKAGGAYAPFDPGFPQDRLAFMAEDTAISILLSQSHLNDIVPCKAEVLFIDKMQDWQKQASNNPTNNVKGGNLFNVIYTSGSTGKPKGVMVTHEGIINRLLWMQATYPINAEDNILQKTPYSFDVSVWELFWPLITGAKLVYAKPDGHKDADYLKNLIQQEAITTLHFVPSMLGIFLQAQNVDACSSIKRIFCSGEALQIEHERRFFDRLPDAELHNLYGPTEASVDVSFFACQKDNHYRSVPIGKPVANTQLHILDKNLRPVPIGMVGELYIGGIQLARGYLNRQELTNNTFIENPFYKDGHPSARLYKTGDLARYQSDGNIEYIGRVDFQVKVRGLRIELGEIENVLHQQATVKETIVVTKEVSADNVLIVAYVVSENEPAEIEVLRQHLSQQLPEYMLPNAFVFLEKMPLSPNGKVNRKQLPEPELSTSTRAPYEPARSETEHTLVEIWQEVLNQEQIGINDNFFDLGGHSLLATQVMSRINEQMNSDLPLRVIFESPSIAQLALKLLETELEGFEDDDMEALLAGLLDEEDDGNEDLESG